MKKAALALTVLIIATVSLFAQDFRGKASENPLDCALFLYAKDKDSIQLNYFAFVLFKTGRYDDALRVIDAHENSYSKIDLLTSLGKELLDSKKVVEADKFLTKAFVIFRADEDWSDHRIAPLLASSLARANRASEAFEILARHDEDETKAIIIFSLAESYFVLGRRETAEKFLNRAFELRSSSDYRFLTFNVINLFLQNGEHQKAAELLRQTEDDFLRLDEDERKRQTLALLPLYFKNKQNEKAFELWNEFADKEDSSDSLGLVLVLLKNNETETAASLFKKIRLNEDKSGDYGKTLIEIYLKLGDVKSALAFAREMSEDVDDYQQQSAFMLIADKLIADKKINEALNLLDFAYQRAEKVGEEHRTEQSIGASSLTRKIQYLTNIKKRYFQLRRFEKGLAVTNALKIRDSHFQEFYSATLIEYAKNQIKTLPRKRIDELLTKAVGIFDEDEDYRRMRARISIAEIYAQIGDKPKAVELLAKSLEEAKESCCYEDDVLLEAGKVFEENKLKADANMKKILREFLDD